MELEKENGIIRVNPDDEMDRLDKIASAIEGDITEWLLDGNRYASTTARHQQNEILDCLRKVEADGVSMADMAACLLRRLALSHISGMQAKEIENFLGGVYTEHVDGKRKKTKDTSTARLTRTMNETAQLGADAYAAEALREWGALQKMYPGAKVGWLDATIAERYKRKADWVYRLRSKKHGSAT